MINDQQVKPVKLYFAYGSNLSLAQMRERCPDSVPIAAHILPDHRLEFVGSSSQRWGVGGVATVVPQPGSKVYGALYRLTAEDEARLDLYEAVNPARPGEGKYVKNEKLLDYKGEWALLYLATAMVQGVNSPSTKYLGVIRQGYRDWGLPLDELAGITPQSPEAHAGGRNG